ncbi:MAG TPA: hypothetical protein VLE95_07780 [Chlamydiales bacterium]|nr:hypothetical protein [Chlamydiales bacterium]
MNLYTIDAAIRGADFVSVLNTAFGLATVSGEVVIQTMATPPFLHPPGLVNGVIPYVQQSTFTAAPHSTMFIVPYNPNGAIGITPNTQYIVIGIEQIVTLAYRNTISPPFSLRGFTSVFASNVLPLYTINPVLRAADIQSIANTLITSPTAFNGTNNISQTWILTTLGGPFYVPFSPIAPGLIPNVTAISVLSPGWLLITYKPISFPFSWSVIVSAEQVQQIIFYPTNPPPS